jgi:hypothetical protein
MNVNGKVTTKNCCWNFSCMEKSVENSIEFRRILTILIKNFNEFAELFFGGDTLGKFVRNVL